MDEVVRPFDAGQWFPIHNAVFDEIMPNVSGSAWKILCVAIRQTWGWVADRNGDRRERRLWDRISYSQFREKAGLGSDATVRRALQECIKAGYLVQRSAGPQDYEYSLNQGFELTPTESIKATSTETVEVIPTETVEATPTDSVDTKQTKQNETVVAVVDEATRALRLLSPPFEPERVAREYAARNPLVALAWAAYAGENGLGGGFVRKQIDGGESPPPTDRAIDAIFDVRGMVEGVESGDEDALDSAALLLQATFEAVEAGRTPFEYAVDKLGAAIASP